MPDENMPVFVKIDDYKNLIEVLDLLKKKLDEARASLDRIVEIKTKEDRDIELWREELEQVHHKINFIDSTLFNPKGL